MRLADRIEELVRDRLRNKGYELVQVNVVGGVRAAVEIFLERLDLAPVSLEDCTIASRLVSAMLDVEDIMEGKYNLNISSPGEYRPLRSVDDFKRFVGGNVQLELRNPLNGCRKFTGKLIKVEQNSNNTVVYLREECDTEPSEIAVSYENVRRAKLRRNFAI
jgi:ribosome maturation factor RimP